MTKKKTYVGWWIRDDQNNMTGKFFVYDVIVTSDHANGTADIWNRYDKVAGHRVALRDEDNIGDINE